MNETTIEIPEGTESVNLKLPPAKPAELTLRALADYIHDEVHLVVKERYFRVNNLTGEKNYVDYSDDKESLTFHARSGRHLVNLVKRCPFVCNELLDRRPQVSGDGFNCARVVVYFDTPIDV